MIIRPSNAHFWFGEKGCHAFPRIARQFPERNKDTTAREDGIRAHAHAEHWIKTGARPDMSDIPDDMADSLHEYVRYVQDWQIEQRLDLSRWFGEGRNGTPDAVRLRQPAVADLKTGRRHVEVKRNVQLSIYALAQFGTAHAVTLQIFQPTHGGWSSWAATPEYLVWFEHELTESVKRVNDPNAKAQSGPYCRNCPALFNCSAAYDAGVSLYEAVDDAPVHMATPRELSARLTTVRIALDRVKSIDAALTAEVEAAVSMGQTVPGWQLQNKQTPLHWKEKNTDELFTLGDLLGVDLRKKPDAITPTQAKRAGVPPDVLDKFATRSNTVKLIPLKNIEDDFT